MIEFKYHVLLKFHNVPGSQAQLPIDNQADDTLYFAKDIKTLCSEFHKLVLFVQRHLQTVKEEEALEECKEFCLNLCVGERSREPLMDENERQTIEKFKTFKELFRFLREYWDWDEISILRQIIEICESKEADEEIEKYERKMALHDGLKLIFNQDKSRRPPAGYENFVVIMDKPYTKLTIEQYIDTKKFILDNLDVHQYICRPFIRVLYGSVHLHWHIKVTAVSHMIKVIHQRKQGDFLAKFICVYADRKHPSL